MTTAPFTPRRKVRGTAPRSAALKAVCLRLPQPLIDAVRGAAAGRRVPITALYEAALRAYLSPSAQDNRDAMLSRHLTRLTRAVESVDWNTKLLVGMLSYLIELQLGYGPEATTEEERQSVEEKGARRFDRFEQWLVQHLVDPENLYQRLQSAVSPKEQAWAASFVEEPATPESAGDLSPGDGANSAKIFFDARASTQSTSQSR